MERFYAFLTLIFHMEYQEDIKMSPVLITPDLELNTEEQHWFLVLTFLKQIIA